jgi:hypothetical protein
MAVNTQHVIPSSTSGGFVSARNLAGYEVKKCISVLTLLFIVEEIKAIISITFHFHPYSAEFYLANLQQENSTMMCMDVCNLTLPNLT